jgi:hypothetical protein
MDVDEAYIEAEAYYKDPSKERYFVKITFIGLDMFINSFVVQPTRFEGQPMWVQEPKYKNQNRWASHVEFNKHSKLLSTSPFSEQVVSLETGGVSRWAHA